MPLQAIRNPRRTNKMVQFIARLFLLISVLLFGILLGIQQAEQGIFSIQGISSKPLTKAEEIYITKIDGNEVEVASSEESFSTSLLEEKQELWQERYHHNKWSHLGNKLGDFFYSYTRKGFHWVIEQIDKFV